MSNEFDAINDNDMPDGMAAKPRMGDLEEAFIDVMPRVDPAARMPPPINDAAMLEGVDADASVDDLDDSAVERQERADADAAAFFGGFDTGLDAEFRVID